MEWGRENHFEGARTPNGGLYRGKPGLHVRVTPQKYSAIQCTAYLQKRTPQIEHYITPTLSTTLSTKNLTTNYPQ